MRIVILLDCRRHRAPDTDAITAHLQGLRLPRLIEEGRPHRLTVLRAERKDLSCLNAAANVKMSSAAGRAQIALRNKANIRHSHFPKVTLRVDVDIVKVLFICARYGIVHPHCRLINHDTRALFDANGAHKARASACCADGRIIRHAKLLRTNGIRKLHLIDLVVAAQKCEDKYILLGLIGNRLDRLLDRNPKILSKHGNRMSIGRCHLLKRQCFLRSVIDGTQCRLLITRSIAARITAGNT